MKTAPTPGSAPAPDLLPRSLKGLYARLPEVLFGSVVACVAATLPTLVAPGVSPASIFLYGLVLPAAMGVLLSLGDQLALGADEKLWVSLRAARRAWLPSTLIGLATALPVALVVLTHEVWQQTGAAWVLPCLAVAGALAVVAVLLAAVALPVVLVAPAMPARSVFRLSLTILAFRPVPVVACAVMAGMGVWIAVHWAVSLLLLVPGPVAVALCAAVWTSALDLGLAELP